MNYLVVFFMMFSMIAIAQETPQIIYEAQIYWITGANAEWANVTITYSVVDGAVTETHAYWSTLGTQKFVALACDHTEALPRKVLFQFDINALPDPKIFTSKYQVRIRGRTIDPATGEDIFSEWSPASDWIGIINLKQPGKVIHLQNE